MTLASWVLASLVTLHPQGPNLGGTVFDQAGKPVAGARIGFAPLSVRALLPSRRKGRYDLAMGRHLLASRLPRTATDRSGHWRVLLSPRQAALAMDLGTELQMHVTAPGFAAWRRAIGTRLLAASQQEVRLSRRNPAARLRLRLKGKARPPRGFVRIERPFRVRGRRAIWLGELLPIDPTGQVSYDEPPRICGELAPSSPTARAEGYRVTILAAGYEALTEILATGSHHLTLEAGEPPRRILAERAEPARTPVKAVYLIAGRKLELSFDRPAVPLLGGEMPVRIETASGPVKIDSWDPDLPMFVGAAQKPAVAAPPSVRGSELLLRILDEEGQPLYAAGIWLENQGVRRASLGARVFAVTDSVGLARLTGLGHGTFRLLVRHPTAGARETLVSVPHAGPLAVRLRPRRARPTARPAGREGSLLLDLEHARREPLELGMLPAGAILVRRRFGQAPRFVRVEGLVPGPAVLYLRLGEEAPVFLGGVLAGSLRAPALHPFTTAKRRFRLRVRGQTGTFPVKLSISLGERPGKGFEPYSARFFAPRPVPDEPGLWQLELRLSGSLWVSLHDRAGQMGRVLLPAEDAASPLEVGLSKTGRKEKSGKDL